MGSYRLPKKTEERLQVLARKTGRSVHALAREAVLDEITVIEDYYLAVSLARRRRARQDTVPHPLR